MGTEEALRRSMSPISSPTVSDARSPQPYMTSSIARSRSAAGSLPCAIEQALDLGVAEDLRQFLRRRGASRAVGSSSISSPRRRCR